MTIKTFILHQLREMKREVLAAIEGLSEEDLTSHEPGNHWPIAWIVQHCCSNVDIALYKMIKEKLLLDHEKRFRTWPLIEPRPEDEYPPLGELQQRWSSITDEAIREIEKIDESRLHVTPPEGVEPIIESVLRVINHQNSHLRNIWCILGERRVDKKWAEQQTWLA